MQMYRGQRGIHCERAKQAGWKTTALRTVIHGSQPWLQSHRQHEGALWTVRNRSKHATAERLTHSNSHPCEAQMWLMFHGLSCLSAQEQPEQIFMTEISQFVNVGNQF